MKKIVMAVVIGSAISIGGINIANAQSKQLNLDVKFRQIIDMPKSITTSELEQLKEDMKLTNWEYNSMENRFERYVDANDVDVEAMGEKESSNENGEVKLKIENKTGLVDVKIIDKTTKDVYTQKINPKSRNSSIVIDMDISQMMKVTDKEENKNIMARADKNNPYWSSGELGHYGDRVHCNRFNGTLSDNRYYPSSSTKGARNFIGSDCDLALLKTRECKRDYGPNPFCAASPSSKQGSCSRVIKHYTRFHSHK